MITHKRIHVVQYLSKVVHDFKQIFAHKKVNHFLAQLFMVSSILLGRVA